MKLAYTDSFSLGTTGVLITKGSAAVDGEIPEEVAVRKIYIEPASTSGQIVVRGVHPDSAWVTSQSAGDGYALDGLTSSDRKYFWIKSASGTITVNLHAFGETP